MTDLSEIRRQLNDAGLRLTTQVRLITVPEPVREEAVAAVAAAEMIETLEPGRATPNGALFETRVAEGHNHVICRTCGANADIWDGVMGVLPNLDPSATSGYIVDEAEVTYWGTCPQCQESGAATRARSKRLMVLATPNL